MMILEKIMNSCKTSNCDPLLVELVSVMSSINSIFEVIVTVKILQAQSVITMPLYGKESYLKSLTIAVTNTGLGDM